MKKIKVFLFFVLLASGIAVNAMSPPPPPPPNHHGGGCVNTPLDGGLLSVLGLAGVGFYLLRKNNKKKEL
jgi:hypothetical protein